jgi:hypothetical protein
VRSSQEASSFTRLPVQANRYLACFSTCQRPRGDRDACRQLDVRSDARLAPPVTRANPWGRDQRPQRAWIRVAYMTSWARFISPARCRPRSRPPDAQSRTGLNSTVYIRPLAICGGGFIGNMFGPRWLARCYCNRDHLCRLCAPFHMGPRTTVSTTSTNNICFEGCT